MALDRHERMQSAFKRCCELFEEGQRALIAADRVAFTKAMEAHKAATEQFRRLYRDELVH